MSHSGDDHCFVARQPALEAATRQLGKRYPLAIRPDEEGRTNLRALPAGHSVSFFSVRARIREGAVDHARLGVARFGGLKRVQLRFRRP